MVELIGVELVEAGWEVTKIKERLMHNSHTRSPYLMLKTPL
jgi:hypothetical protein